MSQSSHHRHLPRERGSLSVEMVLVVPLVVVLLLGAVQLATWYHARALAMAGAQEGARVAAGEQASTAAGVGAAHDFLADTAAGALLDVAVTGSRGPQAATVTVTGSVPALVPWVSVEVRQSATVPTEQAT